MNKKPTPSTGLSRRDFFAVSGLTAAAFALPSFLTDVAYATNENVTIVSTDAQTRIDTDVLVVGGGMAGAFAAVTAKEKGLSVTLVDKGVVGRSGATPWANTFSVFDEEAGAERDEWIAGVRASSEYVNNLDWLDQMLDASKDRWDDIVAWGLLNDEVRHPSLVLREKLLASGVEIVERTMLTSLLTEDEGRVVGAMGFSIDDESSVAVVAKATIMCAGAGAFKAPGYPIQAQTSDGDAMAYRVGAAISGKEWIDFHFTSAEAPASCWNQWSGMWDSGIGQTNQVFTSGMTLDGAFAIHSGESTTTAMPGEMPTDGEMPEGEMATDGERPERPEPTDGEMPEGEMPEGEMPEGGAAPGQNSGEQILGAATGLGIHKAEGIWPTDMQGGCNVPGLYAAGDALASMLCGSSYVGIGFSLSGSATQGVAAAEGAVEYAQQVAEPTISDDELAAVRTEMYAPRERESGFSPAWVTQVMQNAMFPYFVLFVKQEDRLQAALSTITFVRENLATRMIAGDAHELRLAHEAENMLLNAEMKLRASLFRTESRGTHYREDYPARDDDEWLAWVLIQMDADGQMAVTKEEIPEEWKPDLSVAYEERYVNRFPGELEYLGLV